MTATVSEEFVLPERLRAKVLRRRGDGGEATPIAESLSEMAEWMDGCRLQADQFYRQAVVNPASDPELVEAATRAGFDDLTAASPLQAGLRAALIFWAARDPVLPHRFVDSWVLSRGHPFAVRALAESHGVCATSLGDRPDVQRNPQFLRGVDPYRHDFRWYAAIRLLALLADATDAEYAEAMAAASEYRDGTREQRALSSFLFRERTDWVDGDLHSEVVFDGRPEVDLACWLLAAALTTAEQAAEFTVRQHWRVWPRHDVVPTMLASVGDAVAPLLLAWLDDEWHEHETSHQRLLAVIAELGTEASIRALTDRLCWKGVQGHLLAGGEVYPRRTLRVLAETDPDAPADLVGEGDGPLWARHVKHALALHANAYADAARDELPTLSASARARVEAALDPRRDLPDAPSAALPEILVAPPWVNREAEAPPAVVTGLSAPAGVSVVWAEGEREEWLATPIVEDRAPGEPDDEAIAAWVASGGGFHTWQETDGRRRRGQRVNYPRFFCRAADELVRPLLEAGRQAPAGFRDGWSRVYLARFELLAFPMTLEASRPDRLGMVLPFRSPDTAAFVAESFIQRKQGHDDAVRWLARHADYAAEQLIPAAVGKPGRRREAAALTVRWLGAVHGADVVSIAAAKYGAEAAEAIRTLVASAKVDELPKTLPAVPSWAESFALPQIALADGSAGLPPEAVHHLGQMLALSASGEPHAGIAVVKELCDAVSLREYAWALFDNWRLAGHPTEFGWALTALRWLGDDEIVRRLDPLIRVWPGQNHHARAVSGLDVYAAIGTDFALTTLCGIAQRLKFKGLKARAAEKIDQIGQALGLTGPQLADRLVPDLGLDAAGELWLDFGPRRFVAGFDAELKPVVRDEDGKRLRSLPKPGVNDDPELAKAATASFAALKKQARTVVADQVARMERAMVTRRRWDAGEFSAFFLRHPLMRQIARQVVWATFDARGALVETFRVAEDLTLADLDDELFTPAEGAAIGIAHPLDLGKLVGRWSDVLADYRIVQPFAQLGRQPQVLTEAEAAAPVLNRFDGIGMPPGKVAGLTRRGWERGEPRDGGVEKYITRPLPDGRVVVAYLDPGLWVRVIAESGDQTFEGVWISRDGRVRSRPAPEWSDPFGTLDPVTASEILRDLTEVTAQ